ncbi:MAG: PBECR2 nuclease fold domain-containing protein [Clostridia bacterium]
MNYVGKIDKEIYKVVASNIVSDEVIITDERIKHIKQRHPNDFERYNQYFNLIVENPDYIIESNKPNTALILKEIKVSNEVFKTVLRLVTSSDENDYKNSIITFMRIDKKEWDRLLRNKKILYKAE